MNNNTQRNAVKKCLKTSMQVNVIEERGEGKSWFVRKCLDRSSRCIGLGCFLAELGGDDPFVKEESK